MSRDRRRSEQNNIELKESLDRQNAVRSFFATIAMCILIPVFLIVVQFSNSFSSMGGVKIFLACCEVYQIAMAIVGYLLIINNEMDRLLVYSRADIFINAVILIILGIVDCKATGSTLFFFVDALFVSLVPVYFRAERRLYVFSFIAGYVIMAFCFRLPARNKIDIAIAALVMYVMSDIIQEHLICHEKMNRRLKAKTISSESDPLTGLTNRRGLGRKAATLWPYCSRTATQLGLIEIDIDFFKKYNDRFGHPAGDKCLKLVANAIKNSAKRGSDITARTGGEEFLVFVQGMNERELVDLAMKIRKNIDSLKIQHAYVNISNYVTVSMGVAVMVPGDNNSFEDLYEEADQALYTAKENGRNCIVCSNKIYGRMRKGLATVISV